ncbi:MAG: transposase [bacterium]
MEDGPKIYHNRSVHVDDTALTQYLTFRLLDAFPPGWDAKAGLPANAKPREVRRAYEDCLDRGHGDCLLREPQVAETMEGILRHFDGERYELYAWVVMPNHVHALAKPLPGYPLGKIVQGWKGFGAHEINRLLERTGALWQPDYFDRFIRHEKHFGAAIARIHLDPVRAGLVSIPEEYPWSSARVWAADESPYFGRVREEAVVSG